MGVFLTAPEGCGTFGLVRPSPVERTAAPWLALLALTAAAALGARCSPPSEAREDAAPGPPAAAPARPDILLISVDTLRADRLSAWGHGLPTSPFADTLAAQGVRFSRAYSTSSWTVPSLVSMLTSSYPSRHGMGQTARRGQSKWAVIPETLPTLAELLREQGYRTYGLTANFGLPAERGFGRGFGRYHCVGAVDRDAVKPALDAWLPELESGGPWFLWLHLFDPHAPYTPRERYLPEFWSAPRGDFVGFDGLQADKLLRVVQRARPEALDYLRALYDSEIRDTDDYVREVVQRLEARKPLIVFTADHGEEFMEHGGMGHGHSLHQETIHIPLIVRLPDRRFAGTVVDQPASLIDVAPTVLALAGLAAPAGLSGTSLFGPAGPALPAGRSVFAELERGSVVRASIGRRLKLIHDPEHPEHDALYDLEQDPGERGNLAATRGAEVQQLARQLAQFVRDNPGASLDRGETPITPQQLEALRNLGYLD